ncbi:MAG TPA: LpqB family beta-propeller domain-containing protein [Nocardioides sp.]|jgi:hypothetical protein|nr:LpqB family beta-propeller domain-containing protein [Nocardioides sp.]
MTPSRRVLRLVLAVTVAATVTSCVGVPTDGPVVEAHQQGQNVPSRGTFNNPPPPSPGATQEEIMSGFLDAMTATPLSTRRAQEFLTTTAREQWRPVRVLSYSGQRTHVRGSDVVLRLLGAEQVGAVGQWQGRVPDRDARITFPMVRQNGEWRIAQVPNALIVPEDFYASNYESASLYYFDPTGRILVPEPVHVPQGSQLATALVNDLLHGAPSSTSSVSQTFIPPGLSVDFSVPVSNGVAEVSLSGSADSAPLDRGTVRRMLAQFAWTLRQDPSINAFTLKIAGRPVTDATGASTFSVGHDDQSPLDPSVPGATEVFFALRRGRLVSGQVKLLTPVGGPFGSQALGVDTFAVDLPGQRVAAVLSDSLVLGSVLDERPTVPVLSGSGLLRPAWDFANRLWEVQNGPGGARVVEISSGRPHDVRVPGITGEDVRRFLVSRDGSRLVAVVHRAARDRILVSRLRYDPRGRVIGAARAHRIPWSSTGTPRIRDIGWTSPTTIAVLDQLASRAEVRILNVDGSTRPSEISPIVVNGEVRALATSPGGQSPYAVQRTTLVNISPAGPTRSVSISGLREFTYAG